MKTLNRILFATALATTISLAHNASAQFKVNSDDGIAASPKVRQMLNEQRAKSRTAPASVAVASVSYKATSQDGIAASPKLRQTLNEWKVVTGPTALASTSAAYRAVGDDGITASPKLRQQLNERRSSVTIAPLK
jgi:membrane protease subunit (stomatin/prohibitin family)